MECEFPPLAPRYSFAVDIEVTDVQSGTQIRQRTNDLTLFGCGVNTSKPFPKGTRGRIKLSHRGADVAAPGRGAYARPWVGMGGVFTSAEPKGDPSLGGGIT